MKAKQEYYCCDTVDLGRLIEVVDGLLVLLRLELGLTSLAPEGGT